MPVAEKTRETIQTDEVEGIIASAVAARVAAELEKQETLRAEAIQAEVARQLEGIHASLAAMKTVPENADVTSFMRSMVQELALAAQGGVGQKPTPPEEIAKRTRAGEKMRCG